MSPVQVLPQVLVLHVRLVSLLIPTAALNALPIAFPALLVPPTYVTPANPVLSTVLPPEDVSSVLLAVLSAILHKSTHVSIVELDLNPSLIQQMLSLNARYVPQDAETAPMGTVWNAEMASDWSITTVLSNADFPANNVQIKKPTIALHASEDTLSYQKESVNPIFLVIPTNLALPVQLATIWSPGNADNVTEDPTVEPVTTSMWTDAHHAIEDSS